MAATRAKSKAEGTLWAADVWAGAWALAGPTALKLSATTDAAVRHKVLKVSKPDLSIGDDRRERSAA
jgi:hypothetical protein